MIAILGMELSLVLCVGSAKADNALHEWAEIVQHYLALGEHRSGTGADRETSLWLQSELQSRGLDTHLQDWPLNVFQLKSASIDTGGESIEAFPFWYPSATGPQGIEAPLLNGDAAPNSTFMGSIALYRLPPGQLEFHYNVAPVLQEAALSGALAAIVILDHPVKAVSAQNAVKPYHQERLPLPALIAAEADAEKLLSLSRKKALIRLVLDGTDSPGMAMNVVGRLDRSAPKWVVISTPISGWFKAGNERGPGIAMWLQLARWVVESGLKANFIFAGLSGHELAKMGMEALVDSGELPPPDKVSLWLHLGSGIAVETPLLSAVSSTIALSKTVESKLLSGTSMVYWPEEKMPQGSEQFLALQLGYPVAGLFGADPGIHTRLDQSMHIDGQEYQRVLHGIKELIRHQIADNVAEEEAQ